MAIPTPTQIETRAEMPVLVKPIPQQPYSNDPFFAVNLATYLVIIGVSILGGLVQFIRKLNQSTEPQPLHRILGKFLGEMIIAVFAGLLTFWICMYVGFSMTVTVVMVSISAHMGGKAIDTMVDIRSAWIEIQKNKLK